MVKKKIVFILNNFAIGGTEKFLLDLVTELRISYDIEMVSVLGVGPLSAEFEKISVSVKNLGLFNFYNRQSLARKFFWFITTPFTLIRIVILLHKVKPDIVITSLWHADVLGVLGARLAGVKKIVLIQHDTKKLGFFRKHIKNLILKFVTNIIANSEVTKEFLIRFFCVLPEKIIVIHIGINIKNFEIIRPLIVEQNPTLGFIGRLEPVKGCFYFLEALSILKKENKLSPAVIIAGTGSLKREMEECAKNNNLSNVKFLGEIINIHDFLRQIDVLVVPSIEEGFGLVVLEGLVSKKVVVLSDIPVFRELLKYDENGVWFKVGDSNNLAQVLGELLEKPDLIKKYLRNVMFWGDNFVSEYEIKNVAKEYSDLLIKN